MVTFDETIMESIRVRVIAVQASLAAQATEAAPWRRLEYKVGFKSCGVDPRLFRS